MQQLVAFVRRAMKLYHQASAFPRMVRRTAGTRPVAWLYGHIQEPLDRFVYRRTSGRATLTTWLGDVDMAMRTNVVLAIPDGERLVVIASNYGRHQHPAWYYNLRADPRASIEIGGVARDVVAHELHGAERERFYQRGVEVYPGFTLYRRRARREIPVLAFDPVP
jgi:deazaflavin-dependent oxidoreductase (nitroreductase family)